MSKNLSRMSLLTISILVLNLLIVMAAGAAPDLQGTGIHINEIRIDQPSTDYDEYFELAGTAGTSLDGLTYIVIGDSTSGLSGVIEAVVDLTGQNIPSSGYFVAAEGTFSIGTADFTTSLNFENNDNVTHLLVRDFSGANGDDLDTNDDGVLESTPWGTELDRIALVEERNPPSGTEYHYGPPSVGPDGSFVPAHVYYCSAGWEIGEYDPVEGVDTPGEINSCEVSTPEVIVNEIMQNPSAVYDSAGEWFELYNPTDSAIDINGWTIEDNGTNSHVIVNGGPLYILADGYLVLGNNANTGSNGGVVIGYEYTNFFLANGDDEVVLLDGTLLEIDRVEYDGGPTYPDPTGASMQLINPVLDNNVGENWCTSNTTYGAGDLGTPGAANDCPVVVPEIVINEIMQNPSAVYDSAGEWFELYNPTGSDIDIDGWTIQDNDSDSHVINNGGSMVIPAAGYLVLGINADAGTNGGVFVAYQYSGFFLGNSGDEVVLIDSLLNEIDRVEYDNGATFPDPTGASMTLSNPALDNNVGSSWCEASTPYGDGDLGTPGVANFCRAPECDETYTHIYQIQGNVLASPLEGSLETTQGIVVGDFQDGLGGFHLQDPAGDGVSTTSDGLFIYSSILNVSVGDEVRVTGTVDEYYGLTELTSVSQMWICSTGSAVAPTSISLPVSSLDELEMYEGMLVTFSQSLYISEYYNFDRYGEIVLTTDRQYQPTSLHEPGSGAADDLAIANALSRIKLDDGRGSSNPDPARHPNGAVFDLSNRFRGGDRLQNVTGVIDYAYGAYKIQPTQGADYFAENPRPLSPANVGGDLKVASFNVLNYFTTLDNNPAICGDESEFCRGADNATEFTRQQDKIFAALAEIDADVVGLMEIENNGIAVADLVSGLNDLVGVGTYAYVNTGVIGPDAIAVAMIYKPAIVTPESAFAVLDDPSFLDPNNLGEAKNRPALAQTFSNNTDGAIFTIVVNHFKSKGSPCGPSDDDPVQGNCNQTRTLAANVLRDWLSSDPTGSGDPDFLIIGDLNAYDKEDPIDVLVDAGYTDLVRTYEGEYAYTYVFDGQLGYLDHALSSPNLTPRVTGVDTWHINADEPDILDYDTTFKKPAQDALYEPDAFRASDHDPVILGFVPNEAPVCSSAFPSIDLLWPLNHKFVLGEVLGVTDGDGHDVFITIDSIFQDEPVDDGGDGSTAPDGIIGEGNAFELRAERSGDGDGRVYHVFFTADDGFSGTCSGEVLVGVPHDQGKNVDPPVDDGALFDSTVEPVVEAAEVVAEEAVVEPTPEPTPEPTAEPDVAVTPEPTEEPKDKKDK